MESKLDLIITEEEQLDTIIKSIQTNRLKIINDLVLEHDDPVTLCRNNVCMLLSSNSSEDFIDMEIKLDTSFYYYFSLLLEYSCTFIMLNSGMYKNKEIQELFDANEISEENILTTLSDLYTMVFSKLLKSVTMFVIETVKHLKSLDPNYIISTLFGVIFSLSDKFRLIVDSDQRKGILTFWKASDSGDFKEIDTPIILDFVF